jgi:hypothetical protein
MNTTIRNRLFSALVILLGSFVSGVMVWALTQPAPHAWLWWALLPSTCFLCFFTMLFAGSPGQHSQITRWCLLTTEEDSSLPRFVRG